MSGTYTRVFGNLITSKLFGHAERNIANIEAIKKLQKYVEAELNKQKVEK
jgi:hypothetical protein